MLGVIPKPPRTRSERGRIVVMKPVLVRSTKLSRALAPVLLLTLASAQDTSATNEVAGLVSSQTGAALVKQFMVAAGSVIVGAQFINNDDRSTFPKVTLLRGPASRISEATVLAEFTNVRAASAHRVTLEIPPVAVESAEDLYLAVSFPPSNGVRGASDGPGIAATQLTTFGDCFVAPTSEEAFQPIDLDLAITLLYRGTSKVGASDEPKAILRTFLAAGGPNPATSVARVQLGLERRMLVQLGIYNVAGRRVRSLAEGPIDAGVHTIEWDGKDERGRVVATGVYIARLQAGETILTQKIVLAN